MQFEKQQVINRLTFEENFNTLDCTAEDCNNPDFRLKVKQLLSSGEVLVEFVKLNGETRVMTCTTSELFGAKYRSIIHLEESGSSNSQRKLNDEVCSVWDIVIGQWRSFKWSNLKRIDFMVNDK